MLKFRTFSLCAFAFSLVSSISYAEVVSCNGNLSDETRTAIELRIEKPKGPGTNYMNFKIAKLYRKYGNYQQALIFTVRRFETKEKIVYKDLNNSDVFRLSISDSGDSKLSTSNNTSTTDLKCAIDGKVSGEVGLCPGNQNEIGKSLIVQIMAGNFRETSDLIIECMANVNLASESGCTPLLYAVDSNCGSEVQVPRYQSMNAERIMVELIKAGANVDALDSLSLQSPLHKAVLYQSASSIEELIHSKANLNLQDINGETPLMLAVKQNSAEKVKAILDANPRLRIRNNHGLTAYDIAVKLGLDEIIAIFEN